MKSTKNTALVVPPNDPEAVMIRDIAEDFGIDTIESSQPHGATLGQEPHIVDQIIESGYKTAVIVELPGPEEETRLRDAGIEMKIIDHHEYTNLDRAHDKEGNRLPASLTQFLDYFEITNADLRDHGFDPQIVHGIAFMDGGYVWALREKGYTEEQIREIIKTQKGLMESVHQLQNEEEKEAHAREIWDNRVYWNGFYIVENATNYEVRSRISLIIALEIKEPTPLVVVDKGRGFIYVQETKYAPDLFAAFGGFTFGNGNNWGIKTTDQAEGVNVTLKDVKDVLQAAMQKEARF